MLRPTTQTGLRRAPEPEADLASQLTLSGLENAVNASACDRMAEALLDLDGADGPTHGAQEGSAYHGYYQQHISTCCSSLTGRPTNCSSRRCAQARFMPVAGRSRYFGGWYAHMPRASVSIWRAVTRPNRSGCYWSLALPPRE